MSESFETLVAHADDNMILAQQLGHWISRAPDLEIDIALGNIALDHLGVARALYTHAGEVEGAGRGEDDLAMFRDEREYRNLLLVEQPNGAFAQTMVRQVLFDAYQLELWDDLARSEDLTLAGIAAKAAKEAAYHFRFSSGWVVRLGDGTKESHRRTQRALDSLWRFTDEMVGEYSHRWHRTIAKVLDEATLVMPDEPHQRSGGRAGLHSEHLGRILAEMQWMQRSYTGMSW